MIPEHMYVLTDNGYALLSSILGTPANIWCGGRVFRRLEVDEIGYKSACYHVAFDNGMYLTCHGDQTMICANGVRKMVKDLHVDDHVRVPPYPTLMGRDTEPDVSSTSVPLNMSIQCQTSWLVDVFSNTEMTHQLSNNDLTISSYRLSFVRELQLMLASHWNISSYLHIDDDRPNILTIKHFDLHRFCNKDKKDIVNVSGAVTETSVKSVIKLGFEMKLYLVKTRYDNLAVNGLLI